MNSNPYPAIGWADPARAAAFDAWLRPVAASYALDPASVRLASADASFRRYLRIDAAATRPGGSAARYIIMDAPPGQENCAPFVEVARLMAEAGLRVPQVLQWDEPRGFMLLSDLGARTMMDAIDRDHPEANRRLYLQAVEALIVWQKASRPGVLAPYDAALLQRELALFPDWYLGQHRGVQVTGDMRQTLDETFALIVQHNLAAPRVYVHRDFMPRNLMLPDATNNVVDGAVSTPFFDDFAEKIGVLDFQDAVYGPITYDIASLLRDAFLSWPEDFVLDITIGYWEQARKAGLMDFEDWHSDFGSFWRAVEWMGLQRHLKVAGIFARLTLRDGKPKYLADTPRFIGYIRATASRYRQLAPLLKLIDAVEGHVTRSGYAFARL